MKLTLECLPCLLRQSLEATRLTTLDAGHEQAIMDAALACLSDYKRYATSPQLARAIHRRIQQLTGSADPYREMKLTHIQAALDLYDQARARVMASDNPLLTAVKAAAAGNLIDAAIYADIEIGQAILDRLDQPMAICDLDALSERLRDAKTILIIGDNAGESVFDRLLAEQLHPAAVYYAVKSQPIINDATLEDARLSGLESCTRLIESGCDSPGTILEDITPEFADLLWHADIVISKGQGNYEGLSDVPRDMFFLLKAKCPLVAGHFGVPLGSDIFRYQAKPA
ncbi:MAG: ARMT1-like domain-containing protein [Eubacteriales bacterium]|jgi:uncharacterized protein with ATP-grasp and redox domains|nr:ARMT1-like domain-containing protein [Eubacteriales bacterium]MDD4140263.1 ARMT1-like domain-containing protein [Eubacteriales bacterium]MDD4743671.1 ARMT1-like domain-containing protein [Eubacteriales bacterium]NLO36045.1 DUF89 family protein [Clostridiaceae bacterium]